MDHMKTLGIKFIVITISVFSIFGILFNATLINLFWISLFVTGVYYLIGDLFILRKFGTITATIADFGLAFLSIWLLGSLFLEEEGLPIITLSAMAAFFITICEPFIHAYIAAHFSDNTKQDIPTMNQLQTEYSEEIDPKTITEKKERSDK